ncbi:FAD/NAD(P)-binding domain-containing protein [Mycena sanguinolenta]|uniref:FAD/NAD(P)-binding domain-containing protein n=1 Tax=Mycena sanguinolenta TaxID=230812 RepID=A0A8H6XXG0_9AGAR|nr:FAD/NAD(P)-binding domain-containing protein [Mycena sanguinolenta]
MHQTASNAKKSTKPTLTDHYLDQLQFVPGVREFIGEEGSMISDSIKSAADYSYSATRYSGDHFRIIGDAARGLSAALTVCASIKGQVSEAIAQEWHDSKVGIAHTRFLFVVLGAYQQMHLQMHPILSDINAKNFDEAFKMFCPVIYGLADSSKGLTDSKVQDMMDTFQNYFDPYVDEEHVMAVRRRYGTEVIRLESPVLEREKIMSLVKDDNDGERVLKKIDAARVFTDDIEVTRMGRHPLLGYVANIEKGQLGLRKFVELSADLEM